MKTREIKYKHNIGDNVSDEKRDLIIINRKSERNKRGILIKYYQYKCKKCGFDCTKHYSIREKKYKNEYWVEENNFTGKLRSGCACCCVASQIVVEGINDIPTTAPELIPYFQGGYDEAKKYGRNSGEKIRPICPDCGRAKDKSVEISSINYTHSIGCPCSDGISYPNKFMFHLLKSFKLEFISEYSPEWIKPRRYDFYIPSMNLIIEMDGGLGHGKNDNKMDKHSKEYLLELDNYKDDMAKCHGISKVVRIDCNYSNTSNRFEHIKQNILNDETLNKLFDLSLLDWDSLNKLSLNNLIKVACEYKKNYPILSTGDIGLFMGFCRETISHWLKFGNELGWCSYNPKEEQHIRKSIEILKDGRSLGSYTYISYLIKNSEKILGIKITPLDIHNVCIGNMENYNGYVFRYNIK